MTIGAIARSKEAKEGMENEDFVDHSDSDGDDVFNKFNFSISLIIGSQNSSFTVQYSALFDFKQQQAVGKVRAALTPCANKLMELWKSLLIIIIKRATHLSRVAVPHCVMFVKVYFI